MQSLVDVVETADGYSVRVSVSLAKTRTIEEAQALASEIRAVSTDRRVSSGGRDLRLNVNRDLCAIGAELGDTVGIVLYTPPNSP